MMIVFFFKKKTAYDMRISDWSSDVCSSDLVDVIDWWKELCERNNAALDNSPSAGNKAGGLTTVFEKSLGGIAKGGTTGLMEVYQYAEAVEQAGLVFMNTPGYDPISATGQVAGGANMICLDRKSTSLHSSH